MITPYDFFEATGTILRKPLKNPVLREAFMKSPEAVKQVITDLSRDNSGHVLRISATDDFGNPRLFCRQPMRETHSTVSDITVAWPSIESVYMTNGKESIYYGEDKVQYTARDVSVICASGAAYRVCYYDTKGFYQKQEKDIALSMQMRASTLTCFLYSIWTLRLGNTFPLLPKGSVYGN